MANLAGLYAKGRNFGQAPRDRTGARSRQQLKLKLGKLRFRLIHLFGDVGRQVRPNRQEQGKNSQMQDLLSDAFTRHIHQRRPNEFHVSQPHFSFT